MTHSGPMQFFPEVACSLDKAQMVLVPVPYDGTSTWGKGADKGPDALIRASEHLEAYDIETRYEVSEHGFYTDVPVTENQSPEAMTRAVYTRVKQRLDQDKFCMVLGGEHSVSIGAVQAHAEKFSDLSVLQLDAHSDLRDEYRGSQYNHACVMARIRQWCSTVQVGIRSMDAKELSRVEPDRMFFAADIIGQNVWVERAIEKLASNVYVTIDLDVFDSSLMPSTGTPEPGGLFWYDVMRFLRRLCKERRVVGFDVVELCPNQGNRAPDFMAAKLVYKFASYIFSAC
ncbi:MAG: agmatinase [Planctomycetes bacterium]|nr:agmatinase [Planctomycetota bacterium]